MPGVASFEIDLASAFQKDGPLGAAVEILRTCFGWDGPTIASAEDLLSELQKPSTHALVEWHQDLVLSPAKILDEELSLIAAENQSVWQAVQHTNRAVELGSFDRGRWDSWRSIDLDDLLLRLLATEAVLGHGPCLSGSELPEGLLKPFELLPPVQLRQGPAELMAVVASDTWFGVTSGIGKRRWLYASPIGRARTELEALAPKTPWSALR